MNKNINDYYWMNIVDQISHASTCRVKLACILTKKNIIVGIGYTGSVSGDDHCEDVGCLFVDTDGGQGSDPKSKKRCIKTLHSEINAVLKCQERGGIECYCSYQPCLDCLKVLLQIGVIKIVYRKPYQDVNRDRFMGSYDKRSNPKNKFTWYQLL